MRSQVGIYQIAAYASENAGGCVPPPQTTWTSQSQQLHVVQVTSNSKKSSYMYSMQLSYNRTPLSGKGNGHLSITCDKSMQRD